MSKYYSINLIRAKSAYGENLRNLWNLNTKFDLIQNLLTLLPYAKAFHLFQ